MQRRFVVLGIASVLALALAVPALGGPSNPIADGAATAKKTANKALKKSKKASKSATETATALAALPDVYDAKVDATSAGAELLSGQNATSASRLGVGKFKVTFGAPITGCSWVADLNNNDVGPAPPGFASVSRTSAADPLSLTVHVYNSVGTATDPSAGHGFSLQVVCPSPT
jgi:hypothetical protein